METNGSAPDAVGARAALADVDAAQRAVRDTPWPVWLYPVNAVLLGLMALSQLLGERSSQALLATAVLVVAVNLGVGRSTGVPFALPTSRVFLGCVAASAVLVVAALVVADLTDHAWPVVVLAAATSATYLAGALAHRRSTAR